MNGTRIENTDLSLTLASPVSPRLERWMTRIKRTDLSLTLVPPVSPRLER